jgi:hypothetical protein
MAVREIAEATPRGSNPNHDGTLNREIDACEKEDRSLDNLVAHIGEVVMRHVKNRK